MWPARPACRADDTHRQRTANKRISYLAVNQTVIKSPCSWSPQKSRDHEQSNFVFHCISTTYKNSVFAVRNLRTSLRVDSGQELSFRTKHCHSERSEESGAETRGRESLLGSRSFADAQDDRRNAQDDRSDAQDDRRNAQDDRRRQLKIISVMRNLKTMDLLYGN